MLFLAIAMSGDPSHALLARCRTLLRDQPCKRVVGLDHKGGCVYGDAQNGTVCLPEGGLFCNPVCTCRDGKPVRVMRNCDDGNPCTKDRCEQNPLDTATTPGLSGLHLTADMCVHEFLEDYTPCSNEDFTVPGHCKTGECMLPEMDLIPD